MAMKVFRFNPDDLVAEYRAGKAITELMSQFDIGDSKTVWRYLAPFGYSPRPKQVVSIPSDELVAAYVAGDSENALAKRYGCDRNAIRRRLLKAGVQPRGQSEAEALKWNAMTDEQRAAQVASAHEASRGRTDTFETKAQRAATRQARQLHTSPTEYELARMLRERGIEVIHQQAIGPYNCDIGASPVAVEIFGGQWHWSGDHMSRTPERFNYILNAGWHIIAIGVSPRRFPLVEGAADYVAAFYELASRDPSMRREYRVIRGAGELLTAGSVDDDEISIEPSLTSGRDARSGRYVGVPR